MKKLFRDLGFGFVVTAFEIFVRNGVTTLEMERAKGVEPSTFSLATRRSTTELCPPNNFLLSKTLSLHTNHILTFRFDLIMERGTNQDSSVLP